MNIQSAESILQINVIARSHPDTFEIETDNASIERLSAEIREIVSKYPLKGKVS